MFAEQGFVRLVLYLGYNGEDSVLFLKKEHLQHTLCFIGASLMPISSDLHLKVVLESGKAVKGKIYVPKPVFQVLDLHLVNS